MMKTSALFLGDEFDESLRSRLMNVLCQLGAHSSKPKTRFLTGSQELEQNGRNH